MGTEDHTAISDRGAQSQRQVQLQERHEKDHTEELYMFQVERRVKQNMNRIREEKNICIKEQGRREERRAEALICARAFPGRSLLGIRLT